MPAQAREDYGGSVVNGALRHHSGADGGTGQPVLAAESQSECFCQESRIAPLGRRPHGLQLRPVPRQLSVRIEVMTISHDVLV